MIIVRRVIHKKTTSFGLFTPEQLGQTFQCNFDRFVKRNAKGKNISPPKVSTGSLAPSVSSGFKTTINSSGIPAPLIGAALGIGVAATAHYFWRKHRSKNGKQIIERVRRK